MFYDTAVVIFQIRFSKLKMYIMTKFKVTITSQLFANPYLKDLNSYYDIKYTSLF